MLHEQSDKFNVNHELTVFIINNILKKMLEDYENSLSIINSNAEFYTVNINTTSYRYNVPEGGIAYLYLYEEAKADKYFSGAILESMKHAVAYLYKDLDSGDIGLNIDLPNEKYKLN